MGESVSRDERRVHFADDVVRDARYALRAMRRNPVLAAVAILSLALGIGANAAVFHLIDAVRLRSLPIANAQELAEVRAEGVHGFGVSADVNAEITYPLWEQIRARQTAFTGIFAWGNTLLLVGRGAEARRARGLWVSGDFFRVLGIKPALGRLFTGADDYRGCAGALVVSHAFWRAYFGGRDTAIGSPLMVLNRSLTVVGVTPADFNGLEVGQTFDVAVPACAAALWGNNTGGNSLDQRDLWWLTVMGRLKPDSTIARASEQLRSLSPAMLEATIPAGYSPELIARYRSFRFEVIPAGHGVSRLREAYGTSLAWLLGLTGLLLAITCGNLATLMLARAGLREREIAVRVAIGASRARLVSQMLIESLMMSAAGAALAIPVALLSGRALVALLETSDSHVVLNLSTDWRLIAFVATTAGVASMLFGLVPALRASLVAPIGAMQQASRGLTLDRHRLRFQRGLIVAQIAVSSVLVVSALLFVETFRNLAAIETGFDPAGVTAVSFLDLPAATLPLEHRLAFQQQLTSAIRSVPGVARAAAATNYPLSGAIWSHFFRLAGSPGDEQRVARFTYVSPGYFDTLRIPILAGRDLRDLDTAASGRVLLVNESFVRGQLGGRNAIGTMLRTVAEAGYPETTYEIVGVVGNTKYADLRDEPCWCAVPAGGMPPIAYVPIAQDPGLQPWASILVRSGRPPSEIRSAIARRVAELNPAIAVQFTDLPSQIRGRLVAERTMAWLAGAFGVLAMALVAVGLYGIIGYVAVSRRNEIGIRVALGCTRAGVVTLVLGEQFWLLAAGLAIGLPLALGTARLASTAFFGLSPTHIPTLLGAVSLLASTAAMAGGIPAWTAAKISPDVALRSE